MAWKMATLVLRPKSLGLYKIVTEYLGLLCQKRCEKGYLPGLEFNTSREDEGSHSDSSVQANFICLLNWHSEGSSNPSSFSLSEILVTRGLSVLVLDFLYERFFSDFYLFIYSFPPSVSIYGAHNWMEPIDNTSWWERQSRCNSRRDFGDRQAIDLSFIKWTE